MTINVINADFTFDPNVKPGDGLQYQLYTATEPDSYSVNVYYFGDIINYWVFVMDDSAGSAADTINTSDYGTFEAAGGDDLLLNYATHLDTPLVRLLGGAGDDQINPLSQSMSGGFGPTEGYGGSGNDTINGGGYADQLHGDSADSFTGDPVIATIALAPYDTSNDGDDAIAGYGGADALSGDGGDDSLFGGDGADTLLGGAGNDLLYGGPRGAGNLDILTGGTGGDSFLLSYNGDGANDASGFWSQFFAKMGADIAGNEAKVALQDAIKAAVDGIAGGILAAGLGQAGSDLAGLFVDFVESLFSAKKPVSVQDVMVVTDFDPREDLLILPLQSTVVSTLSVTVTTADQIPGGAGTGGTSTAVLKFSDGDTAYAYVQMSQDFVDDLGLGSFGDNFKQVLRNLGNFKTDILELNGTIGLSNLVSPAISSQLPDGGFQPQAGNLPSGAGVAMFGAIGGWVINNPGNDYGAVLSGTNFADALSTNPKLIDPSVITTAALSGTAAYIYGFGGNDLLYGSAAADTLSGGDGDDALWSFVSPYNSGGTVDVESLSGGDGNDTLYGGGTAGIFDGGSGTDTFAVVYIVDGVTKAPKPLQLAIDLVAGQAAERAATNSAAPVGDAPPFPITGPDAPLNVYALTGIENAVGGPLNDWIRGASGSAIEGGPGADYLIASSGAVSITYAGSTAGIGVSVLLFNGVSSAGGGDATGDVIGYGSTQDVAQLIGTAYDDDLGAYSTWTLSDGGQGFTMIGGGGADDFLLLGFEGSGVYVLPDFTFTVAEPDSIDLRLLGVTSMAQIAISGGDISISTEPGGPVDVLVRLPNFTGTLTDGAFVFSNSVSGTVRARPGMTDLTGSDGADDLVGSRERDTLLGRGADDVIRGRLGDDHIDGGAGQDSLAGGSGDDVIIAGAGDDSARAGVGDDMLLGGDGADSLRGGAGRDRLLGDAGDDTLLGGADDDVLEGGTGADLLRGGTGSDSFLLRLGELAGDRVEDFRRAEGDRLVVLAGGPVTVTDQGSGLFLVSDGTVSETLSVRGAAASDFIL